MGLHKTGTTFLQEEVFPKLDINFYNMSMRDGLDLGILFDEDKTNLISFENLSGKPFSLDYPWHSSQERLRIAKRLHCLFPNARILVGIRNKEDWLYSVYKQHAKMTGIFRDFKSFKNRFDNNYLDFKAYIDFLKEKFPEVYVYRYEELKKDHQKFVDDICSFIGVDPPRIENIVYNKSLTKGQLELIDAIHRITKKGYKGLKYLIEIFNRRFSS